MGALEGKVAMLVGAGSGIGRDVLTAFGQEGAKIVALELDSAKCVALSALGSNVLPVQGDATTIAGNRAAVDAAVGQFGGLDILVTFVGVFDYYKSLAELPDDVIVPAFDEIFRTNVLSYILSVKSALRPLQERKGAIVLTLSTSSFYPGRGGVLYVATKFAGRGLVVELAHELAPEIRVNGVAPGGTVGTELRGLEALGMQQRTLGTAPGRADDLASRTPLRVALTGADHAGAYVFLASEQSRGTSGTVIKSDGGVGIRG